MTGGPILNNAYINFYSGKLSLEEVDALFRTMPYELDYINADDQYEWYSPNPWRDDDRLHQRLNHHVYGCHPKRVLPMVKQVLQLLKSGKKDMLESPQIMDGKRTLIRYYAVRAVNGHYLGTLQVTEYVEHIAQLTEQHAFEHGIVEGKVPDAITSASQHQK
ncbi:NADPH-dependent FMN reductase [Limosilactobacillus frumenti DSM 13145]|uniref:NADPH-dependent FMN reductase n=1 Tax=Limosilactobacillus frumenti DSM 13145 TaxID=1423746 RepID=A0A0R1P464_9LACO|nr:PAS domain-containing protein [Limosilactobacillus frumenti]KRL27087.1 NADPH-dependent FMN reductase [Limosilactobacillus frumenti DSM 13145]MBA2913777.1 NADPH-dependent FMN reductase [Limosilactobacillus frumenti]QFG72559.1 NADPH-dependent FMN reductase [Limosilactobacillus frumenti]